jgi:hypothetical protein
MLKEEVLAYFKVLYRHLPGGIEENCKKSVRIAGMNACMSLCKMFVIIV